MLREISKYQHHIARSAGDDSFIAKNLPHAWSKTHFKERDKILLRYSEPFGALAKTTIFNKSKHPDLNMISKRIQGESLLAARQGNIEQAFQRAQSIPLPEIRARTLVRIADIVQKNPGQRAWLDRLYEAALASALLIQNIESTDLILQSTVISASDACLKQLALRVVPAIASPRIRGAATAYIAEALAVSGQTGKAFQLAQGIEEPFARASAFLCIESLEGMKPGQKSRALQQALAAASLIHKEAEHDDMFAFVAQAFARRGQYAAAFCAVKKIISPKRRVQAYLVELLQEAEENGDSHASNKIIETAAALAATIADSDAKTRAMRNVDMAREALKYRRTLSDHR